MTFDFEMVRTSVLLRLLSRNLLLNDLMLLLLFVRDRSIEAWFIRKTVQ